MLPTANPSVSFLSLRGPVEKLGDRLVLCIPLDAGGEELHLVADGISHIDGDDLIIDIPRWLAEKLLIDEGTEVYVDNRDGRFNLTVAAVN